MNDQTLAPLLPRREYLARIVRSLCLGLSIIAICLGIGMVGYHCLEKLSWIDAFLNASMILSGMGPVATLQTDAGKLFAGFYALFSGLALISIIGIIMGPFVLRFLHKFHLDLHAKKSMPRKP
ncbi:MAG TPA: hypothetical protein VGR14_06580 [Verrucomicrobiae bacterium]|jgi:hypothetical protein|nr:hypothetical protein [Verrucomicrobiae bacterium]